MKSKTMKEAIEAQPAKILLVDDKESNLVSLQSILQGENYVFRLAQSGKEVLRILLKETDFTLIIMDVIMPEMDGFQTAFFISEREKLKDIPIIFLTANDQGNNIFKAYNLGAVDYISKPLIPELLKAKVQVFVELNRKNKALEFQTKQLKEVNDKLEKEVKERKASEEKIKKLNEELSTKLEELESLDSFSYSVSHDLKNPLTSIALLMEILLSDCESMLDENGINLIHRAQKQIERVDNIIRDLLLFSRHGSEVERQEVNMNEVVNGVLEEMKLIYSVNGRHKIKIDNLPQVKCDSSLIKQVWSNLLSNAIKYSNEKDVPEITIEAHGSGKNAVFSIQDNGIGFDSKDADKLFKVFSRMESAKRFEGTGIGLAIVKRIIEKHGGSIWYESKPDVGTSFFFTIAN